MDAWFWTVILLQMTLGVCLIKAGFTSVQEDDHPPPILGAESPPASLRPDHLENT